METSRKTLAFSVQAVSVTSEMLKGILRDFLSGNLTPKGKKSYNKLSKSGKLDNIEVTENNIKDFLQTAKKYDIDFALKRDKSTSPPTYHIFFSTGKADIFQKAFQEYAIGVNKKLDKQKVSDVVNRQQIKENAKIITQKQSTKDKDRHKSKSDIAGR